jgi:hypothetical protein
MISAIDPGISLAGVETLSGELLERYCRRQILPPVEAVCAGAGICEGIPFAQACEPEIRRVQEKESIIDLPLIRV